MRSLAGALRLAAFDAQGLAQFDPSVAGTWRSFYAWPVILLMDMVLAFRHVADGADVLAAVLLSATSAATQMAAYFLAVATLFRASDRGDRLPLFITTYNWTGIIGMTVLYVSDGLATGLSTPMATGVGTGTALWVALYSWFTVRSVVGCTGIQAAGLVVLEVMIAIAVQMAV